MIMAQKSQQWNVDSTTTPILRGKKKTPENFDAPYHKEYSLRSPRVAMLWRAAVKVVTVVGWAQIVATFDLKVASPLLVLRDAWRTGPDLI